VADPSIFPNGGRDLSIAEEMTQEGLKPLEPASNQRVSGWNVVREHLLFNDKEGPNFRRPHLVFFKTCYNAIRTIPGLVHDEFKVEDLNSDGEDHAADAIRYGLVRLRHKKSQEDPQIHDHKTYFGISTKKVKSLRDRITPTIFVP